MNAARWRLLLAAGLFVAWLGYLIVLAVQVTHPVVQLWPFHVAKTPPVILSRPQFLASSLDVIADVQAQPDGDPNPGIEVLEVHWPGNAPVQPNQTIRVTNLTRADGWQGPGRYILPLARVKDGTAFEVVAIPPSPGFDPKPNWPRIYPDTPETREQLEQIPKVSDE